MFDSESLPDVLPESPLATLRAWFDEAVAAGRTPNPNAIALATADEWGNPSVRIVLLKILNDALGYLVFFTNHQSRKGRELAARPRAAVVLLSDHFDRQIRVEGPIVHSPAEESDAYFASRALISRIGSSASAQSQPIESREAMLGRVADTMEILGISPSDILAGVDRPIPRPPHWGGFRLWFDRVELWTGGSGRVHDRAAWTRSLTPGSGSSSSAFVPGTWSATRLQP